VVGVGEEGGGVTKGELKPETATKIFYLFLFVFLVYIK
jgi:hypothetical protein